MKTAAAIIIPAHNESRSIARTLRKVTEQTSDGEFEVIVVCNGCTDSTASIAAGFPGVDVVDIPEASKLGALRVGDRRASAFPRVYLDADTELSSDALRAIVAELERPGILVSGVVGRMDLSDASLLVSLYCEFRERLPIFSQGIVGSGNYALNEAGRARFDDWPDLLSGDDQFILRMFTPRERSTVKGHTATLLPPSTMAAVVRRGVRTRRGNRRLSQGAAGRPLSPPNAGFSRAFRASLKSPRGIASALVFVTVTALVRLRARGSSGGTDWASYAR